MIPYLLLYAFIFAVAIVLGLTYSVLCKKISSGMTFTRANCLETPRSRKSVQLFDDSSTSDETDDDFSERNDSFDNRFFAVDVPQVTLPTLDKRIKLCFCLLVGTVLISFVGLRSCKIGSDTEGYVFDFYESNDADFALLYKSFFNPNVDDRKEATKEKDVFFKIMLRTLGSIFNHHQYFLFIYSFLSYFGVFYLFYRYSQTRIPILCVLLYMSLGQFTFGMSGIRQAAAIGMTCLSFPFIEQRDFKKFLITLAIACLFHKSALVFFPAYFCNFPLNRKTLLLYLTFFLCFAFFSETLVESLENFVGVDRRIGNYVSKGSDFSINANFFFLHLLCFIFCLIFYRRVVASSPTSAFFFNLVMVGNLFGLLSGLGYSFCFRLAFYYLAYEGVLIEKCCVQMDNKPQRVLCSGLISICCIGYFFKGLVGSVYYPYRFFWQDPFF